MKDIKMMPHSIESEQSVLGCILIDKDAGFDIMTKLKPDDFYSEAHHDIFEAAFNIFNKNVPVDYVTLIDELERENKLDAVGNIDYITTLTNVVPSAANYKHYVEIVKRYSVLRKLIEGGREIIEDAYNSEDKNIALANAEKKIFDISQEEDVSSLERISGSLKEVIDKFDKIAKNGGLLRGISTGLSGIDETLNGLQNSDLILIAARPGVGKTSLAMNMVINAAINEGKKCAIFSLEMPKVQLAQRALCSVAKVSMSKALKGKMEMDEWKSIWTANKKLSEAKLFIDDSSMTTPMDILSKCRRLKRQEGLDLIMIDYLQLMNASGKSKDNRLQEISEITRTLKIAAKELDVPILLLSQLSRAVETRNDHRPQLSDLRDSGSIEQDADIVMFIYNPDNYNDVTNEEPGVCEILIAKHRNGSTGTVKLKWIGEFTTFVDIDVRLPIKKEKPKEEITEEEALKADVNLDIFDE